jgi:Domain of Unknown Function with PDB structure (DUF3857)/Transglutaminase-like superfamily
MKFIKFPILLFIFSIINQTPFAQKVDYSALTISGDLKKNANEIVRLDYTKFVVDSKKQATLHVKYVVTLLNGKSRGNTQYVSYADDEKINELSASVYDAFGNLVERFKKKDFTDQSAIDGSTMYSDNRIKFIELKHNSYPYTVEIEYKKTFKGILFYPNCYIQHFNSSLEHLIYIAEVPKKLGLRYKSRNIDVEPDINQTEKTITYKWTIQNQPAFKSEEFMPSSDQILPFIEVSPLVFQYGQYVGDVTNWESFGKFFYTLGKGRDELSPEMATIVRELTAGLQTNEEKIEVLYGYLKENMRYVSVQLGIGGFQPFDAKYVEKNKYGDCKALSNFMLSMLKEAGITAEPGIIYRSEKKRTIVDENFPALFGNHMLIYIPAEDIWLECTSNDYPVNYLGASNDNRSVLLVSEEGGKLTTSPAFKPFDNTQSSVTEIKIAQDGSANIESTIKTKGPKHEIYRDIENQLTDEDFEKYFLRSTGLPAFNIEKLEVKAQKESPEAQLDYHLKVPRYATKAGKRLFIPVNKLNVFDNVPSPNEKRIHPIEVIRGYYEVDEISFALPEGYEVESIPNATIDIETDYGKYKVKIEVDGSTLTYQRMLEIQAVHLLPEEFELFRNFYKEIAKADAMKIVLVKKRA